MTRLIAPLAVTTLALCTAPAAAEIVFIKAGRLLDVEHGRYLEAPLIEVVAGNEDIGHTAVRSNTQFGDVI